MENEKKNANAPSDHQSKKNKQRKHKSYFMTPADAQGATPARAEGATQNKPQQNNRNHDKNKRKENTPAPQNNAEKKEIKNIQAPATQKPTQNAPHGSGASRNRNNKRKRHHDKKPESINTNNANTTSGESTAKATKDVITPVVLNAKKSDRLEKPAAKKLEKFSSSSDYEKYSDYEEFSVEELYGDKNEEVSKPAPAKDKKKPSASEPMVDVVGIRFKSSGKTYYFAPKGFFLKVGSHAIVETARGLEYGEVALGNTKVRESETVPPLRPIIRVATEADKKHHAENKEKEDEAFRVCNEKIIEHELDMKLIDAQYTFDNSKLLFYFTSSGRVDFRNLVKDLAGVFRTRIELRQIGIRDEAKMVGGLGLCGRPLCCSLFLTDFGQVSIKMAKEQNLSLNSSKISGICGRLMCCLRYEHETYEYEIKRTPPVDSLVRTVDGVGVVTEISPLAGTIKVRLNDSPEVPPKSYKRDDVTVLKKKKEN